MGNYFAIGAESLMGKIPAPPSGNPPKNLDYHCTLIYSQGTAIDPEDVLDSVKRKFGIGRMLASVSGFDAFDALPKDGERDPNLSSVVMRVYSETLCQIHDFLKSEFSMTHSYPEYSPHITLFYDVDRIDSIRTLRELHGKTFLPIYMSNFRSEHIKNDWNNS